MPRSCRCTRLGRLGSQWAQARSARQTPGSRSSGPCTGGSPCGSADSTGPGCRPAHPLLVSASLYAFECCSSHKAMHFRSHSMCSRKPLTVCGGCQHTHAIQCHAGPSCHRRTERARSLASAWAGARPEADRGPAVLEHGVRVPEGRVKEVIPRRSTRVPQPAPVAKHPEVVPVEVEGVLLLRRAVGAHPRPVVSACKVPVILGTVLPSSLTLTVPRATARHRALVPAEVVRVLLLRCVFGAAPGSCKESVGFRHGHAVQSQTRSCIQSLS